MDCTLTISAQLLADAETLERLEQLRGLPPSISDVRFQLDPTVGLIGAGNIGNGLLLLLESANDEFAVPIQRDTTQEALPWRYNRLLCSTAIQDEAWHEEIEAALRSAPAKELIDSAEDFWAGVRDDGSAGAPAADEDKADDKEYWERYDQVEPVVGEPSADKRAAALLQTLQGVWALYRSQAHPQDDEAAAREFLACAQEAIKL